MIRRPRLWASCRSRRSELQYLLRPMLEAAAQIHAHMATVQFILPLAETLQPADVQEVLETAPIPVQLVQRQTYEVMQAADVYWWLRERPRSKPHSSGLP